ncbi:carbohydrate ABC transporter substrate-binding protein [Candidatus Parcubacteria bacterium]|nr:carbohydrate ABC transporter substrate-binding protein [Candidatus Parcubacteria bacterium]
MSSSKDLNIFQVLTIVVFLVIGIIGIAMFATGKAGGLGGSSYKATIWGVLPKANIDAGLESFRIRGQDPSFTYIEYPEEGFEQAILKAIAEGNGPDAIIFPDDMYYSQFNKLLTIPNTTVTTQDFASTYLDIGNKFTTGGGIKAFPILLDPLVMYYNVDLLKSEGVLIPPKDWVEFANLTEKIVRKRDNGIIDRAYTALGEYDNVDHAKDILFAMLAQVGVNISFFDPGMGAYVSGLIKTDGKSQDQQSASRLSREVMIYYTEFANPTKTSYTWNKSFKSSREAFLSGDLAIYFGPGSEVEYMRTRNPNLNFAIAPIPQAYQDKKVTQAKIYSLGFMVASKNPNATYQNVMAFFNTFDLNQSLSDSIQLASARRDVLLKSELAKTNADVAVINNSAIYAETWTDPDAYGSNDIFSKMINSIVTGSQNISDAITDASDRLDRLYLMR